LVSRRQLALYRGRVLRVEDANPGLSVTFLNHSTRREQNLRVAYAVNCTGPECNYQKLKSPLIINLLARGLIHPDPLLLGLNAAPDGAVFNYLGQPSSQIFTLGSAAKGMLYETTAVPELRVQAKTLAERLVCLLADFLCAGGEAAMESHSPPAGSSIREIDDGDDCHPKHNGKIRPRCHDF
jgi:uncharacterized NAD(P)/FAD-binding protein YdhS